MNVKENLKKILKSEATKTSIWLATAVTIPSVAWAGLTYTHNMGYGSYDGSVASETLDKVRSNDNLAERALALTLYPLALAQDAANEAYKSTED